MRIFLDYGFKYYVRLYGQPIVNLVIYFGLPENVKLFECVHHSAFSCCVEGFHNVFHLANGVPVFQNVCGKSGFSVTVFEFPEMFLEPDSELSSGLSGVLHTARGASQLVDSTVISISGVLVPCCQKFFYEVVCAEGDFDASVSEYLRNGSCFSAYLCELSPLGFFLSMFVSFLGVQCS